MENISWDEVAARVYVASWQSIVAENADRLHDQTVEDLPECIARISSQVLHDEQGNVVTLEKPLAVYGSALAVALFHAGWAFGSRPGEAVVATRRDETIEPFAVVHELHGKKMEAASWKNRCQLLGIAALSLWDVEKAAQVVASRLSEASN